MMRSRFTLAVLLLLAAAPGFAQTPAPNITGDWDVTVNSPQGANTTLVTFKQDGEKLTGDYKGAFGEAPLTGTVKAGKVDFEIKGQQGTLTYTGTIEKDGTMKGTVQLGDVGSGTWTGKRK